MNIYLIGLQFMLRFGFPSTTQFVLVALTRMTQCGSGGVEMCLLSVPTAVFRGQPSCSEFIHFR